VSRVVGDVFQREGREGSMLERLKLGNVGLSAEMELSCRRRLNLLTGDNGLGKTFLMDVAWWVLTGHWPRDVNPRGGIGDDREQTSSVGAGARDVGELVARAADVASLRGGPWRTCSHGRGKSWTAPFRAAYRVPAGDGEHRETRQALSGLRSTRG